MHLCRGSCCAWIEVLMPSLRCSCRDCGAQAKIEVTWAPQSQHEHLNLGMSTAILAWAPQSWHEHHNLGMSTAILAWAPQSQHRGSPPYAIFQHPENREIKHSDVLGINAYMYKVFTQTKRSRQWKQYRRWKQCKQCNRKQCKQCKQFRWRCFIHLWWYCINIFPINVILISCFQRLGSCLS